MIEGKDERARLASARKLFERTIDHYQDWFEMAQEDLDFRHGRQWDPADVEALRKQNRPALTFNVIQSKIHHILGTLVDNVQEGRIRPVGLEDVLQAEVLEMVRRTVYDETNMELVDLQVFDDGVTAGLGGAALDLVQSEEDPSRMDFIITPVHPMEVLWDIGSERIDKSDARYVCWMRWLSKAEFKTDYPDLAKDTDAIFQAQGGDVGVGYDVRTGSSTVNNSYDTYRPRREVLYYDRKEERIRVIRIEYRKEEREMTAVAKDGTRRVVPASLKAQMQREFPGQFMFESRWVSRDRWIEFVGHRVLFDDESPIPFRGFSIIPFVAYADDQNHPYGHVRNLKDPQREFNKRYSQMLNMINNQVQPGVFMEQNAAVDDAQAESSMKTSGTITWMANGAVSGQRFAQRNVPQFPEGVARIAEMNLKILDMIAMVSSDDLNGPRGIPEAAATTQLKHRQSLMAMNPVLKRFWSYQKLITDKIIESAVRGISDAQLSELIASDGRFVVQRDQVIDKASNQIVTLDSIRKLRYNTRMEPADNNETKRLMDLQMLLAMQQLQIPIPPKTFYAKLGFAQAETEEMVQFAAQREAQGQQMQQAQMQMAQQAQQEKSQIEAAKLQLQSGKVQGDQMADVASAMNDAAKIQETTRHNQATEMLDALGIGVGSREKLLEMFERANEHDRELMAKFLMERMKMQSKPTAQPSASQAEG